MTHLQAKSSLFNQQLSKVKQESYSARNRLKFEASNADHDVFYSDEDSLVKYELQDQTEIQGIINQAQEDFGRNMTPKEDSRRKGRSIGKRKGKAKNRDIKIIPITSQSPNFNSFQSANQQMQIESMNTKPLRDAFISSVIEPSLPLKIEEKKTAERNDLLQNPPIPHITEIQNKSQKHFHLFPQYRAYFEKQIQSSYDQYQKRMEGLFKQALNAKVKEMIISEKYQKANILRRLQEHKSRFKIVPKVIHSIPEDPVLTSVNITFQDLPVCAPIDQKHQQNANKHHRITAENERPIQSAAEDKAVLMSSHNNTIAKQYDLLDLHKDPRSKRRQKPVRIEGQRKITSQSSGSGTGARPLQVQLNKTNDRNKILASIQLVNRQCEEQEKYQRMESQRMERQRQEKQKSKQAKKQQVSSNASHSNQQAKREGEQAESQRRIQQNIREAQWMSYSRPNPKIKRLEILNRYHYNPFEQTEGEDQCELWKKLMGVEIKNLSSQYGSSKLQDTNLQAKKSIIEELLKEVADREHDKQGKDIFIMPNNYQPNFQSQPSSDEISIPQRRKSSKSKSHKKHKGRHRKHKDKKNSKESRQSQTKQISHEQDIGTFLNLHEQSPKKQEEDYHGPESHSTTNWDPDQPEQNLERQSLSQLQQHEPISQRSDQAFSYDQLDDLEDYQDLFGKGKQVKQEHIEPPAEDIHDIDYYEELLKRQVRK